ncbi:hypothetical protein WNY59_02200 [Ahrensia kielensis]|uniref:Uncharacterized protein n=1 Tax=Ahrensia kielensis TaxID=76980 RepID=A0ABU9T2P0_9HYPH
MRTPAFLMLVVLLGLSTLAAAGALFVAVNQPWLGIVLIPGDDGSVVISKLQRIDFEQNLSAGERLDAIGSKSDDGIAISAFDIVEDPDTVECHSELTQ